MTDAELDQIEKDFAWDRGALHPVPALVSALREARRVLRHVEWRAGTGPAGLQFCPECDAEDCVGHRPGCALAEAIK